MQEHTVRHPLSTSKLTSLLFLFPAQSVIERNISGVIPSQRPLVPNQTRNGPFDISLVRHLDPFEDAQLGIVDSDIHGAVLRHGVLSPGSFGTEYFGSDVIRPGYM